MMRNCAKSFTEYLEKQEPFPWTVVKQHDNPSFIGNNSLVLGYVRNRLIMEAVTRYLKIGSTVLDVGIYPGVLPKVLSEYFPGKGNFTYYGCGIGFTEEFVSTMEKLNVTLFETDLDPRLNLSAGRLTDISLSNEAIDLVLCTDVIEHFFDPNHMLQEINRVLKLGGIMILTTDNVSRLGSLIAIAKGGSNFSPLMESSLYFEGDWRPHFREYSKSELYELMEYAGFEVLSHQYFDCEFSLYKVVNGKLTKLRDQSHLVSRLKSFAKSLITGQWIFRFIGLRPSFRDNQIMVVKKSVSYDEMIKHTPKVAKTIEEGIKQRIKYKKI